MQNTKRTVYIFENFHKLSDEEYWALHEILPPKRKRKADLYTFSKDKKSCVIGYILLLMGVKELYSIDIGGMDFSYFSNGKPYLKLKNKLHFNISHCNDSVVCAISDEPVGIDVQDIYDDFSDLFDYVLTSQEIDECKNSMLPNESFVRIWTLKESYLKLIGKGLCTNLKYIDFSGNLNCFFKKGNYQFCVYKRNEYYIAICSCKYNKWEYKVVCLEEIMKLI